MMSPLWKNLSVALVWKCWENAKYTLTPLLVGMETIKRLQVKIMGKKLRPDQLKLYKTIDEILWRDWDPIGMNDCAEARDEYKSYLPHIFRLALEGADEYRISASLISTIETNIGLGADKDHNQKVAANIVKARNEFID